MLSAVVQPHNLIDTTTALRQARALTATTASYWRPRMGENAVTRAKGLTPSYLRATDYRAFALDETLVQSTLDAAPVEFSAQDLANTNLISLPRPDGTLMRFSFQQSSIMDAALAAKFPDIKTYAGTATDGSAASLRFDVTPLGFHAQIIEPGKTWYIDPYYHMDQSVYASYWRKDMKAPAGEARLENDIAEGIGSAPSTAASQLTSAGTVTTDLTSGTQLRNYRLAVAATGEYTAKFGGTVAGGQAAIVTAINRVTGIYETELSIRLTLVANNSSLVFTNSSTDPYTNNNPDSLLNENQTKIDAVIGSGNYDIGHVFSTAGGGLAGLGVVGVGGQKAQGETGMSNPVGDAFYVDYVAHEMGHQFGGNHTFNTANDTGNRESTTAYEPGSGSTIMAYAGIEGNATFNNITGTEDLQAHSDPYFAWKSLDEINAYVTSISSVGTKTATNNAIPTVSGGSNYSIPINTPFSLTATGSDANGDTIYYSWEEADLGAASYLTQGDLGSGPLFRVYNPTTSPSRTFPQLASILNGTNKTYVSGSTTSMVEQLPTKGRTMKFVVTARDQKANGGGTNVLSGSPVSITSVLAANGFLITNLNSATTLPGGSSQTITWNVANTTASPISTANVSILMSTDGGQTFPTTILASTPNDGTQAITIPNVASTQVRFKVAAVGNIYFDINNANLTTTAITDITPPTISSSSFGYTTNQSNGVTFSESVSPSVTNTANFTVQNLTTGATIPAANITSAFNTGTNTATLTYSSLLADGNYRITFNAITDTAGNPLAGTNTVDFFVLAGDANRDRFVDALDQSALTANLNQTGKTFSQGDFDYSGTVNAADQTILTNALKHWLPALGSVSLPATANADIITLQREAAAVTDVINNGTLQYRVYTGGLTGVSFSGGNSDDVLTLDYSNGTPFVGTTFTFDGGAGNDKLSIVGQSAIADTAVFNAANVIINGTTITDTTNEARTFNGQNGADAVTVNAGPSVQFVASQSLQTLTLAGGKAQLNYGAGVVLTTKALFVTGVGTIDLNDNDLIIDYTSAANPFSTILSLVKSGLATLGGNGTGITSTSVNTKVRQGTTLAVLDNNAAGAGFGSFPGAASVPLASVIVRYTWLGDANLNGIVDGTDYALTDAGFSSAGSTWARGDFDYNGVADGTDYSLLDSGFGSWNTLL